MSKVYVIVHDGADILVGTGGRSGKRRLTRGGYHLPGGTINDGETALAAAVRELGEETGIDGSNFTVESANIQTSAANEVTFVVLRVASVDNLVAAFRRPNVTNRNDEPFTGVRSVRSEDSWEDDNFHARYKTDWFMHGLYVARDLIAPQ